PNVSSGLNIYPVRISPLAESANADSTSTESLVLSASINCLSMNCLEADPRNSTGILDSVDGNCTITTSNASLESTDAVEWSNAELRALLCRIVYPPLLVIGVLCNLLALLTFQQKRLRRSPVSLCLSALAILDSLVLLSSTLRYWLKYQISFDWQVESIHLCRVTLFLEYFTADGSVWTLLLVTVQRYVGTHFPLRAGKYCNRSRTFLFMMGVGTLCAVKNLPLLIRAKAMPLPLAGTVCQIVYDHQLWVAFSWTDTIFRFLIPFPSLLFLNFSICRKVRAARKFRRSQQVEWRSSMHGNSSTLLNNNANTFSNNRNAIISRQSLSRVSRRATTDPLPSSTLDAQQRLSRASVRRTNLDDGRRMLMMLVVVNFVFLACQFPFCVFSLVDSFLDLMKKAVTNRDTSAYLVLSLCFQSALTLVYVSHATNFFFYCLSGRLFRHTLMRMLTPCRGQQRQGRRGLNGPGDSPIGCCNSCCCSRRSRQRILLRAIAKQQNEKQQQQQNDVAKQQSEMIEAKPWKPELE
ncbi:hypothetical protein BOX15_Mlig008647g1, partial [Macrostomum lignano]